jgi:hypothetical protein
MVRDGATEDDFCLVQTTRVHQRAAVRSKRLAEKVATIARRQLVAKLYGAFGKRNGFVDLLGIDLIARGGNQLTGV